MGIASFARRVLPTPVKARARDVERWVRHVGRRFYCPCCDRSARTFEPAGFTPRANAKCPWCGSRERHRLLWTVLSDFIESGDLDGRMLHVAPEPSIAQRVAAVPNIGYVSIDLQLPAADVHADIVGRLPFQDSTFDSVLCSHVLEHVHDDRAALEEIYRVLKPGGLAFFLVPISEHPDTAYDPSITDPKERARLYGQEDHVRVYGQDFVSLLSRLRWSVDPVSAAVVSEDRSENMRFLPHEEVFVCCRE